jgi:hypothetical protein
VTITTPDTPHLVPAAADLPHLLDGVYQVQLSVGQASVLNVPPAPVAAFGTPCCALCSPAGP